MSNALPPPPKLPSKAPAAVTWSLLATAVTTGVIVLGGVMKVDAMFDEKLKEMSMDVKTHVADVYARKDEVARHPVEAVELNHLKEAVADNGAKAEENGEKLDKLRVLILKRR